MKFISFFAITMIFLTMSAKDGKPGISSKIIFQKGLPENAIEGWENDFFQGTFFKENDEEINDTEFPDIDTDKVKIQKKKQNQPKVKTIKRTKEPKPQAPIEKKDDPFAVYEEPEDIQQEEKDSKPPLTEMEADKIDETPDETGNEVDRSDRMRKMKELIKKRKGKNRVEDRRVY